MIEISTSYQHRVGSTAKHFSIVVNVVEEVQGIYQPIHRLTVYPLLINNLRSIQIGFGVVIDEKRDYKEVNCIRYKESASYFKKDLYFPIISKID